MVTRNGSRIDKLVSKLKVIKAEDIMTKDVITTKEEATLADVATIMVKKRISGMPVINSRGNVMGVVTESDLFIVMDIIDSGDVLESETKGGFDPIVKFAMSTDIVKISKNTSLFEIISIFKYQNIHTLPVLSGKKMVGVIGRHDIFKSFYNVVRKVE